MKKNYLNISKNYNNYISQFLNKYQLYTLIYNSINNNAMISNPAKIQGLDHDTVREMREKWTLEMRSLNGRN